MAVVSLPRVKQAQAITGASLVNNAADSLEAQVNGNLDDANFGVNAPVKIVTTLSGESVRAGKSCLVVAGASRLLVTYDATLAKWVSDPQVFMDQQEAEGTVATVFTDMAVISMPFTMIPNFKALYDAGLRPQVSLFGNINPSGAVTGSLRVRFVEFSDGDTAAPDIGTSQTLSHNTETATYKYSDWTTATISPAPTKAHAIAVAQISTSSSLTVFSGVHIEMRWVSA